MVTSLTASVNFYFIFNKGNIEKFTYEENILDNAHLKSISDDFFENIEVNDFLKNKKKILIFGDSHARDLYISFKLNNSLFDNFDFKLINSSTSCLFKYSITNKICGKISKIETSLLNNFDYIILKEKWSPEEVDVLDLNIKFLKERGPNKKIIVIGNGPFFETKNYKGLVSTLFDQNILRNQNFKNSELEKLYYKSYISNKHALELNKKVAEISKKFDILYLNHVELICNNNRQKCDYLTEDKKKIFYDYGHYTLEGAKYLGQKIYDTNWLKIE